MKIKGLKPDKTIIIKSRGCLDVYTFLKKKKIAEQKSLKDNILFE